MKNFDQWNQLKKQVEQKRRDQYFYERDICFVSLGENVGFEQSGVGDEFLRPVVIIKKFNPSVFLSVPLTSREKKGKYYFRIPDINGVKNIAIISQIKLVDAKRIKYKIGKVDKALFDKLKKAICFMINE